MQRIIKAVGYARYSSDNQRQESLDAHDLPPILGPVSLLVNDRNLVGVSISA